MKKKIKKFLKIKNLYHQKTFFIFAKYFKNIIIKYKNYNK